jgi:hypothetical protein
MAVRIPRRRALERFGSYNNLRSNPYSNFERTLDLRAGILDPYTQIAQSVMQTSYGIDTLSSYGNVFRARILGVVTGKPARHLYPDLYANQQGGTESVKDHFIFVLRDESDQFAPDPSGFAASAKSYTNMIGLQGDAISEKPADEEMERYAIGDIVEVYKPEQNSWNGSLVRKVVVRNNFSQDFPGDADGVVVGGAFNTTAGTAFSGSFTEESGYVADNTGNGSDGLWDGAYTLDTPKAENSVEPISSRYPRLRYQLSGIRKWPVQRQLLEILQAVAADQDIYIDIFSGGQISFEAGEGAGRTSTRTRRHDDGWAADISIYESLDARTDGALENQLRAIGADADDQEKLYNIALAFWRAGITGMAISDRQQNDYQDGRFHVDIAYCNSGNSRVRSSTNIYHFWKDTSYNTLIRSRTDAFPGVAPNQCQDVP